MALVQVNCLNIHRDKACSVFFKAMNGRLLLLILWLKELPPSGMARPKQTVTPRYALALGSLVRSLAAAFHVGGAEDQQQL